MKNTTIAIQGARGSFHEVAARKHFGNQIQLIECQTFSRVFDHVNGGTAEFGIAAIENTVAGTILPNYALLRNSPVTIVGEVYLPIQQNLLALPGQSIADIREVHSHPMAILQCQAFFEQHPHIRLVEADDTAARAIWIAENKLAGMGAIAGLHVADMLGLQVLAAGIETHKKNFTRFLVIQPSSKALPVADVDKASVCFTVAHTQGALARILNVLADHRINLTKIQSLPLVGKEWEYYIHVDMEFDLPEQYRLAMEAIVPHLNEFKVLGEYKRGNKNELSSTQLKKERS